MPFDTFLSPTSTSGPVNGSQNPTPHPLTTKSMRRAPMVLRMEVGDVRGVARQRCRDGRAACADPADHHAGAHRVRPPPAHHPDRTRALVRTAASHARRSHPDARERSTPSHRPTRPAAQVSAQTQHRQPRTDGRGRSKTVHSLPRCTGPKTKADLADLMQEVYAEIVELQLDA